MPVAQPIATRLSLGALLGMTAEITKRTARTNNIVATQ